MGKIEVVDFSGWVSFRISQVKNEAVFLFAIAQDIVYVNEQHRGESVPLRTPVVMSNVAVSLPSTSTISVSDDFHTAFKVLTQ